MKNSKSPHRPPEISPESFSFPRENPQGNIISRQIRHEFRVSEPTVPMYGNAITPHTIRKQYKPTGQVTFSALFTREIPTISSATHFQNIEIRPEQYTPHNKTTRTTRKEAPAPHGTGASPMLLCQRIVLYASLYASEIRSW